MPSHLHEALQELYRERPLLAAELLARSAPRAFLEAFINAAADRLQTDVPRRRSFDEGEASREARGDANGEAKVVLAVLDALGIEVPDEVRERIAACTDIEQLDTWVRLAATARAADDLFE